MLIFYSIYDKIVIYRKKSAIVTKIMTHSVRADDKIIKNRNDIRGKIAVANKTLKYSNGNTYKGMVNDGNLPHGIGTMKYADGSVYVGRWGFGAWYMEGTFIDGHRVYVGTWVGTKKSDNVTLVENGEVMYGKMDDLGFLGPNGERLPEPIVEQPTEDKRHNATRNDAPPYVRLDGKTILFGTYPQTIKAGNVTITDTTNDKGYFLGSDGEWYANVVVATPNGTDYKFSNGATVEKGETYYFKVEPIKWKILSENNGKAILMCDSIIANHRFDDSSNNYENSEIRKWLNAKFYNTAFNEVQRNLILTTVVDNSMKSAGCCSNEYTCNDTLDKIFLPSYSEVADIEVEERKMQTSDYSRATGASTNGSTDYYGNGWWRLRSPGYYDYSNYARVVYEDGDVGNGVPVHLAHSGVVPALRIQLN